MARYAEGTSVPVERSRGEIEQTLARYGADQFLYGYDQEQAVVAFRADGRQVRFTLPMPDRTSRDITHKRVNQHSGGMVVRSQAEQVKAYEQAQRQAWRALALVIKAKLEAVESGIVTFEQEFLAHMVLPNGQTVGDWVEPQLAAAYEGGGMPELMPATG